MAARIYIIYYGARDPSRVNTREYADKIATGLRRIADSLSDPATEFLTKEDFPNGEPDNTWMNFSLVTENTNQVSLTPELQFNVHLLIKHITDEDEFGDGITASEV